MIVAVPARSKDANDAQFLAAFQTEDATKHRAR